MKTKLCAALIAVAVCCLGYSSQSFAQGRGLIHDGNSQNPDSRTPDSRVPDARMPDEDQGFQIPPREMLLRGNRVNEKADPTIVKFQKAPNCPSSAHIDLPKVNGVMIAASCVASPDGDGLPPHLPHLHKEEYMPANLPGWGSMGDEYSEINDKSKWSEATYKMEPGDVILAVNDREVFNTNELQYAASMAGRWVSLVVYDPKRHGIYCVVGRTQNGKIRLQTYDTDDGPAVRSFFTSFRVYVYKPTYPTNWKPIF